MKERKVKKSSAGGAAVDRSGIMTEDVD